MSKKAYVIIGGIILVIIGIAATFGLSKKDSYEDPMINFEDVMVCQFYSGLDRIIKEENGLKQLYIDNSKYILKVKPISDPEFDYQTYSIDCEVINVFKQDEEVSVGDTIKVSFDGYYFFEDIKSFNIGFANFMDKDYEYLIFLSKKLVSEVYDYPVYKIAAYSFAPIFNYTDLSNVIIEDTMDINASGAKYYCYYNDVKNNEYFVMDRELEKLVYEFKYDVLSTIDSDYVVPTK